MKVRTLQKTELNAALEWAGREGWNPGLDDAEAFFNADPTGFHGVFSGNEFVACISVVKHDVAFAFLGLYLCHPDWRGQGYGWQVWQAAMDTAQGTVGLDGVVEQQANYRRSGFEFAWNNARYRGVFRPSAIAASPDVYPDASTDAAERSATGPREDALYKVTRVQPVGESHRSAVVAFDRIVTGTQRTAFTTAWYTDTSTRRSYCIQHGDKIVAVGTIRQCLEGYKIGPLFCPDAATAQHVVTAMLRDLPSVATGPEGHAVYLDVPSNHPEAVSFAQSLAMQPVFETARMYRGAPPAGQQQSVFGLTTLELG